MEKKVYRVVFGTSYDIESESDSDAVDEAWQLLETDGLVSLGVNVEEIQKEVR